METAIAASIPPRPLYSSACGQIPIWEDCDNAVNAPSYISISPLHPQQSVQQASSLFLKIRLGGWDRSVSRSRPPLYDLYGCSQRHLLATPLSYWQFMAVRFYMGPKFGIYLRGHVVSVSDYQKRRCILCTLYKPGRGHTNLTLQ